MMLVTSSTNMVHSDSEWLMISHRSGMFWRPATECVSWRRLSLLGRMEEDHVQKIMSIDQVAWSWLHSVTLFHAVELHELKRHGV